ncbi:MAG: DUF2065 family protein [gamma proteobacterium symbiont of Bathyaustriella thionipta]|nr:DUF2065 family protein [gamma proteobacterium symbiont of Bathyaustriella thionipta]MCU7948801.1 DUF2065 family protein [gamma proteobacterium symbiont of Bathyaustriella thionipta]MCU7954213.1 DUF2065 family protein [gamma proteobacterium symbiont of Bathyaustriella thionipta]MCU7955259.1 DUF2065 family protein [gamma proteobacterium symbiont of Bathyaustriella thionipta]MCU7966268.1 DUF2065 family protein [gamma proteobacterium symbiont of Bathyaustriella thionipta]
MWHEILIAGALILVLEGILPILNPKLFKQMMFNASQINEQQLRWTGVTSMVIGAIAIYVLKH